MKKLNLEQGTSEWLELRKSKITSTDVAAILNRSPYKSAIKLWREKIGLDEPDSLNAAMKRGQFHEDDARNMVFAKTGIEFEPAVIISQSCPWLMASLDGLDGYQFLEVKTPLPHNFDKQAEAMPMIHYIQMQAVFAASDEQILQGLYCVYSPENNTVSLRSVHPERSMIEMIQEESEKFWRRLRELDCPPPLHRVVDTTEMLKLSDKYRLALDMKQKAEQMLLDTKEEILKLAAGDSITGYGIKVTQVISKGRVDYSKIPELKEIDLEQYRGKPSESVRITVEK